MKLSFVSFETKSSIHAKGLQAYTIVDSKICELVVFNELYSTYSQYIAPFIVELANDISITMTRRGP